MYRSQSEMYSTRVASPSAAATPAQVLPTSLRWGDVPAQAMMLRLAPSRTNPTAMFAFMVDRPGATVLNTLTLSTQPASTSIPTTTAAAASPRDHHWNMATNRGSAPVSGEGGGMLTGSSARR